VDGTHSITSNVSAGSIPTPAVDLELLTPKDAARLAQISLRQWQRLEAAGLGPARTRLGDRLIRYTRAGFIEWLRQRTTTTHTT